MYNELLNVREAQLEASHNTFNKNHTRKYR